MIAINRGAKQKKKNICGDTHKDIYVFWESVLQTSWGIIAIESKLHSQTKNILIISHYYFCIRCFESFESLDS